MYSILKAFSGAFRSFLGTNGLSSAVGQLLIVTANLAESNERMMQRLAFMEDRRSSPPVSDWEIPEGREQVTKLPQSTFAFVPLTLSDGTHYEISIDNADRDAFHQAVAAGGTSDSNWRFINRWIRQGDIMFDVGANIGTISIPAALGGAIVHSFELLVSNVQHLLRSAERNSLRDVSVVLGAVSDQHAPVGVGGTSAWGTVVENAPLLIAAVVLDDYARAREIQNINLMKIDVEGSEMAALRGASDVIDKYSPDIVIEGNVVTSGNAGYSYRDILDFLIDRGYRIFRLHADRLCVVNNSKIQEVVFADYFATKKDDVEISQRSGWEISTMSHLEVVESIEIQDFMPDLHKQYVLAIENFLPNDVVSNPRVAPLLEKWRHLEDENIRKILLTGAK